MNEKSIVSYVGNHPVISEKLELICGDQKWQLVKFGGAIDFVDKLGVFPDSQEGTQEQIRWIECHVAPVILDLDYNKSESVEAIRRIKHIHAGIPVIVVGNRRSLAGFCVAQMDGAEAFFLRDSCDSTQMCDVIKSSFNRISNWLAAQRLCESREVLRQCTI